MRRRRGRDVRDGLLHRVRLGDSRRTVPPEDAEPDPGVLPHPALRPVQRPHARADVARSRGAGDHRRGRRRRGARVREANHSGEEKRKPVAVHAAARKHGGELHDIDFDGERDEWDHGLVGVDAEHRDFGGDYAAGAVLAARVVHRGEDDLDHEVFHNVTVRRCVADIARARSHTRGRHRDLSHDGGVEALGARARGEAARPGGIGVESTRRHDAHGGFGVQAHDGGGRDDGSRQGLHD